MAEQTPVTGAPPLQTADRVLNVLLAFDRERPEWGVTEIAEEFGLDKSVAQRLLAALAYRGFLVSDKRSRRYRLGPAVWHLSWVWERGGGMASLARPTLEALAGAVGVNALFAVPDGVHMRCVAAVDGASGPLRYYVLAGELYPAHAGATSRAYFGMLAPGDRAVLLYGRPMARFGEHTLTDPVRLEERFSEVRREGYAYSEGEYDPDTAALAAPVLVGRRPVGTLTLAATPEVLRPRRDQLVAPLLQGAADLGRALTPARLRRAPHRERR
ncbi:IclR family transcriptional regulator [Streptomyces rapamycinicus]|uniref:IclR family transcriptional regulator n=2 Tax=Streptomyces rapamycinicus TaxID=1226757 RepID=A0A3L8RQH0_STRRN|nr:IclR family transcriptional regulator [Streptomyces rapamycinicus]MBB4782400.1 DNA-binding IclR family transcriptional regulator [Streptomyces rapamycinicus]RLV82116.1 IclR family transcriptional regulator [Streptomyces rapamycinicus NRRL 5491]UTO62916.1 IclR family transcriptional regulator [Streptomyces rapamycinicus]UTP30874.1 IclR family transcriptional regulator [Streptomyces rapamycinicus NRRL 5491]